MRSSFLLSIPLFAACISTPAGPPETVAGEILAALEAGESAKADKLFKPVARKEEYRQKIYPTLYGAAQDRYDRDDIDGSVDILRFLGEHYPDATAVREALVYGLFLQRSTLDEADPDLSAEIDGSLAKVRAKTATPPVWFDLVETQQEIDRGRLVEARAAYERFRSNWEGTPDSLWVYVDDLERYLASH